MEIKRSRIGVAFLTLISKEVSSVIRDEKICTIIYIQIRTIPTTPDHNNNTLVAKAILGKNISPKNSE